MVFITCFRASGLTACVGVPLRIEIGPRDLAKQQVVTVRRDNRAKGTLPFEGIAGLVKGLLDTIHNDMFAKARRELNEHKIIVNKSGFYA